MAQQFKVGETYATRSIADYDTVFSFTILGRTAKTVSLKVRGKIVRRGLSVWQGVEQFKPFGNYSMCAIVSADKVAKTNKIVPDSAASGSAAHLDALSTFFGI